MASENNLWDRIKNIVVEMLQGLGMFSKDVQTKAYEKTVELVAGGLVAGLAAVFFVFIGFAVFQWWQGVEDNKLNYVDRELRGVVTDAETGQRLDSVLVAVVNQLEDTTLTDRDGFFYLKFRAHKEDKHTELSFRKNGYEDRSKSHPIPLDKEAERTVQSFTIQSERNPG